MPRKTNNYRKLQQSLRVWTKRTRRAVFSYKKQSFRVWRQLRIQLARNLRKYRKFSRKNRQVLSAGLIFVGIQFMILGFGYSIYTKTVLSFKTAPSIVYDSDYRQSKPVSIKIGAVGVDLSVQSASIRDGYWEIAEDRATHLKSSGHPTENTNIVIYAHNKWHLFYPLHSVQQGQIVEVVTEDGETHVYKVSEIYEVTPDEIEVVLPTQFETLTLYTCTGWFDEKRLVVRAVPVEIE